MKSVLIISPFFSPNIGGVESHLNDLCQGLSEHHYCVYVLTYQPLTTQARGKKIEQGHNLYIRRLWWPGFNLFHKFENLPAVFNFIYLTPGLLFLSLFFVLKNKNKIDFIHTHGMVASLIGKILKKIFHKPSIISTHTIYNFEPNNFFSKIARWIFSSSDIILAISCTSQKELLKIGISGRKIFRYSYWVNQQIFKPADKTWSRKKIKIPDKFTVIFVGRLLKIKGATTLLQVAQEVGDKINFLFVGTGPLEKKLASAAQKYSNVIFLGKVANHQLPLYYNAADIFVIPSLYPEAFGKVIIEALSCGLPIVASNLGAIPEIINEKVGFLVKPSVFNFKQKILWLYQHPEVRKKMSRLATILARKKYSPESIKLIINTYEQIASK